MKVTSFTLLLFWMLIIMLPRIRLSSSSFNYSLGEILNHFNTENIWQISLIRGILWKFSLCLGYKHRDEACGERPLSLWNFKSFCNTQNTGFTQKGKNDFLKSNYQKAIHLAWAFQSTHPWSHFLNLPYCLMYGFVDVCYHLKKSLSIWWKKIAVLLILYFTS